jgi:hypothetical protein
VDNFDDDPDKVTFIGGEHAEHIQTARHEPLWKRIL